MLNSHVILLFNTKMHTKAKNKIVISQPKDHAEIEYDKEHTKIKSRTGLRI